MHLLYKDAFADGGLGPPKMAVSSNKGPRKRGVSDTSVSTIAVDDKFERSLALSYYGNSGSQDDQLYDNVTEMVSIK